MIEAFRENGLNSVDAQHDLGISRLEAVLSTVFTQLNKRLPPSQHVNVEDCVGLTLSWLLNTCDRSVSFSQQKVCAKETREEELAMGPCDTNWLASVRVVTQSFDHQALCTANAGLIHQCSKGFSPIVSFLCRLSLQFEHSPCVQLHALVSVCTLNIPSTGSRTFV